LQPPKGAGGRGRLPLTATEWQPPAERHLGTVNRVDLAVARFDEFPIDEPPVTAVRSEDRTAAHSARISNANSHSWRIASTAPGMVPAACRAVLGRAIDVPFPAVRADDEEVPVAGRIVRACRLTDAEPIHSALGRYVVVANQMAAHARFSSPVDARKLGRLSFLAQKRAVLSPRLPLHTRQPKARFTRQQGTGNTGRRSSRLRSSERVTVPEFSMCGCPNVGLIEAFCGKKRVSKMSQRDVGVLSRASLLKLARRFFDFGWLRRRPPSTSRGTT
jgi:hypothetical protein